MDVFLVVDENKMEKCGMIVNNEDVAPYFEESSVVILCKVMGKSDFDSKSVDENVYEWYQEEGFIVNIMEKLSRYWLKTISKTYSLY